MDWTTIGGLMARHALTSVAGWLVGHGLLGSDPSATEAFVGAGMLFVGIAWSWWQKSGKVLVDAQLAKTKGVHPIIILFAVLMLGLLALSQSALAADLPPRPPVVKAVAPAPAQPWSGFYVGVNGAGAKTEGKFSMLAVPGEGDIHPSGLTAGLTVGWGGWANNAYFGIEADGDYDFSKDRGGCIFAPTTCKMRDGFLLTQRVLVGATLPGLMARAQQRGVTAPAQWPIPIAVPDSVAASTLVPYLTAGIAERRMEACVELIGCNKEWLVGWTAGGGIKIPVSQAVTVDVGYLYVGWNKHFNPAGPVVFPADFKATSEHVLKAGLQFHM